MNYNTLRHMDTDDYLQYMMDELFEVEADPSKNVFLVNDDKGHSKTFHIGMSLPELLKRFATGSAKRASTTFVDRDTMISHMANAMIYKAEEIAGWFFADKRDFTKAEDYYNLPMTVNLGKGIDPIGYGVNQDMEFKKTTVIRMVLTRDMTGESPLGFYLTTAYPLIRDDYGEVIKKLGTKEEMIDKYPEIFDIPMQKVYFAHSKLAEGRRLSLSYDSGSGKDIITATYNISNRDRIFAFISDNKIVCKKVTNNEVIRTNMFELQVTHPAVYADLKKILQTRDKVFQRENTQSRPAFTKISTNPGENPGNGRG